MKFGFLISLFFLNLFGYSQNIMLKVLGEADYRIKNDGCAIQISLAEQINDKQMTQFKDHLTSLGVNYELTKLDGPRFDKILKYRIEIADCKFMNTIRNICQDYDIIMSDAYYIMPDHQFNDEDKNAILALENAIQRASMVSKKLNCSYKIISIDDDTSNSSIIYDILDKDSTWGELMNEFMNSLNSAIRNQNSKEPFRYGTYNLWVTFELKPL